MSFIRKVGLHVCLLFLLLAGAAICAHGADVLFYGVGKGHNFQQTNSTTAIDDPVDTWEATAFAYLNPTGAMTAAYVGPVANPTQYPMTDEGGYFDFGASGASQSVVDGYLPNGVAFRLTMATVHNGTNAGDLTLSGNVYPNTPLATNYAAMQSVGPNTNFTIYWNAFTGGTSNDVIIASVVANQYAPFGSMTNSPLPGTAGFLNGTNRAWTIPAGFLQPNSNYWVRVVFYKSVMTNKTAYAGVTGYAVYAAGTTVPLVTTGVGIPAPVISIQPTNQTVYAGSNVSMIVTATGTGLAYQWRRSNTNLSGATASLYSILKAQTNHSGSYTVVVTNSGGAVTSSPAAVLTVSLPPAPTISQHPTNLTVTVGNTANFYVAAAGFNLAYQWRRGGTNLSAATTTSYSVINAQLSDAATFTVVVTNAGGSITSNPAMLTVQAAPIGEGSLDPTFNPGSGANNWVNIVLEQPDTRLLIGGLFTTFNNTNRPYIARLNRDGSLDTTFDPCTGPNNALVALALQTDGKPLIGGFFTTVSGQNFRYLARMLANGTLDPSFATGTNINNTVRAIAVQGDGKLVIGGDFTSYNTTNRNRIARLRADGSLDTSFNPGTGADNSVNAIALQPDGKILIGGSFATVNGTNRASIARLNTDGSLDGSFTPGTGAVSWVNAIALQPDGGILIGGPFTTYNGTSRRGIARLYANGLLDTNFNPGTGTENWVNSVVLLSGGKVAIGGIFTNFNGVNLNHVARLGTNGLQDMTFNIGSGFNDTVQSLVACSDGTLVAGGLFTNYNGTAANRIARLLAAPGAPYPRLRFTQAGNSLTLRWPLAAAEFHLQVSPTLGTAFTNLVTGLTTNGADVSATVTIGGGTRYFRLKKP
jgi:uncharacterized delta-60 repeat protein